MDLILASTSSYRRALLERLGLPFRVVAPDVDEEAWKGRGLSPEGLARALGRMKALAVARLYPAAMVIGSDQVVSLDGRILGKPGSPEGATGQLTSLSGREHRIITSVTVAYDDQARDATDVTTLAMRDLSPEAIRRYVEADRPFDCAGSYKLESLGISLFERIDSADHSAIVGLPLMALSGLIRSYGFEVP